MALSGQVQFLGLSPWLASAIADAFTAVLPMDVDLPSLQMPFVIFFFFVFFP